MTTHDVAPSDSEVWHSALRTLEDGLSIYPLRSIDGVAFRGARVANTAVMVTGTDVLLRVTQSPPGRPDESWEISMPPAFARYLAALLDSHARYLQSATAA